MNLMVGVCGPCWIRDLQKGLNPLLGISRETVRRYGKSGSKFNFCIWSSCFRACDEVLYTSTGHAVDCKLRYETVWCKSSQIWQQTNFPRHADTCALASRTRLNYSFTAAGRVESNLQLSAVTSFSTSTATPGRKPASSSAVKLEI